MLHCSFVFLVWQELSFSVGFHDSDILSGKRKSVVFAQKICSQLSDIFQSQDVCVLSFEF